MVVVPIVLQAPGSSPKPESYEEVSRSELFKHVGLGRGVRAQLHADGNRIFPKMVQVLQKPSLQSFHVDHNKHEFVKKVKKGSKHVLTGTQCRQVLAIRGYLHPRCRAEQTR